MTNKTLLVPVVEANIGKTTSLAKARTNVRRTRAAFPHRDPVALLCEIGEGKGAIDEHDLVAKVYPEADFFRGGWKTTNPVLVPKHGFDQHAPASVTRVMKGIAKKSPTRYAVEVEVRPEGLADPVVFLTSHLANLDPSDPRWLASVEELQKIVAANYEAGKTQVWGGDTNANVPKNMPKLHPKERRIIEAGNDYMGIIPGKVKVAVHGTGKINLTIDGHNGHWAMLGFSGKKA